MTAVLGLDLVAWLAIALLAGGVVGSVVPFVPAGLVSLAGVYLYWWGTGYADPGLVVLVVFTLVGLLAQAADWLSGVVAARAGGASSRSSLLGGVVGFVLLFVLGPAGMILGLAVTVFVLEYRRQADAKAGAVAALSATLGVFASAVVQALLTGSILVGMLLVVLL
jgi:uncharacterized protein YqgC (DUF456 family)